jgi:hypothetical protein
MGASFKGIARSCSVVALVPWYDRAKAKVFGSTPFGMEGAHVVNEAARDPGRKAFGGSRGPGPRVTPEPGDPFRRGSTVRVEPHRGTKARPRYGFLSVPAAPSKPIRSSPLPQAPYPTHAYCCDGPRQRCATRFSLPQSRLQCAVRCSA